MADPKEGKGNISPSTGEGRGSTSSVLSPSRTRMLATEKSAHGEEAIWPKSVPVSAATMPRSAYTQAIPIT